MNLLKKLRLEPFMLAIIAAAVIASILPARGAGVPVLRWVNLLMIGALFYLYGARLSTEEAIAGLRHWRLHGVILGFTYVVFPLLGLVLNWALRDALPRDLLLGVFYVTLLPSTVNSSITFTSIARGNIAGAIVSASASNLIGVLLTPLLVVALMSTTSGVTITGSAVVDIVVQLLVPFVLGQLTRRWTGAWVVRNKAWLKYWDQATIVLIVYSAFSQGMREGIWGQVDSGQLLLVLVINVALIALLLWLTWAVAARLHFNRGDRIAIQFCGTKKSLASGLPMATVLFAGQSVGLIVLPLMIFHQAQLMACSALASRYARRSAELEAAGENPALAA